MANEVEQAGTISTEKSTYRSYVKYESDASGKTIVKEIQTKAGAQKLDKDTGLPTNWAELEKAGYTLFNENEFIRYTVKSIEAAQLLVPDETQFIYIFQSGLNYLQNAKSNAFMKSQKEGEPEPTPEYNQDVIDLKDAINEPPTRKSLSDIEKLVRQLTAMGIPADRQEAVLAALLASGPVAEAEDLTEG